MPARQMLRTFVALLALFCLAGPSAWAQGERRAGGGGGRAAGLFDDGGLGTCADADKTSKRLLNSAFASRAFGPEPDRKDVAYGSLPRQRLDVFLPKAGARSGPAPVIVMVHGGGWCVGDKALSAVTKNKVEHWSPLGFVFVSVNYPMILDGNDAFQQAADVARAVAYVQKHAGEWGGDGQRVILMGHSAGAHLVSLVNADARLRAQFEVKPVLGVVSLDSGATDVVVQMNKAMPLMHGRYVEAFGSAESGWIKASPYHQLDATAAPWLGVCSTQRPDDSCGQAREYAAKCRSLGIKATVLPQNKTHGGINRELGQPGSYTSDVDSFMASLDPQVRSLLPR
jgi:acetyl esterase/lipase